MEFMRRATDMEGQSGDQKDVSGRVCAARASHQASQSVRHGQQPTTSRSSGDRADESLRRSADSKALCEIGYGGGHVEEVQQMKSNPVHRKSTRVICAGVSCRGWECMSVHRMRMVEFGQYWPSECLESA